MDYLMQYECKEKHGTVTRQIVKVKDVASIARVCDKVRCVPNFLGNGTGSIAFVFDPMTDIYAIDDVGAIIVCKRPTLFQPGAAHVHVTFWDKILRGREDLCSTLAKHVLIEEQFSWLWTLIPENAGAIRFFARRVGFQLALKSKGIEHLIYPGIGV